MSANAVIDNPNQFSGENTQPSFPAVRNIGSRAVEHLRSFAGLPEPGVIPHVARPLQGPFDLKIDAPRASEGSHQPQEKTSLDLPVEDAETRPSDTF